MPMVEGMLFPSRYLREHPDYEALPQPYVEEADGVFFAVGPDERLIDGPFSVRADAEFALGMRHRHEQPYNGEEQDAGD
jgi:hypothetical protein